MTERDIKKEEQRQERKSKLEHNRSIKIERDPLLNTVYKKSDDIKRIHNQYEYSLIKYYALLYNVHEKTIIRRRDRYLCTARSLCQSLDRVYANHYHIITKQKERE